MPESLFNKVTGLYPVTLLKEKSPIQVFSDEFCMIYRTSFLQNTSNCFCSAEKYFSTKIVKSPLEKEKKLEKLVRKTTTHAEKKLKHSQIILLFKNFFITLFPASHDILKAQVFRNNAISLRIYLL